jgi:signal transduction protein with GAF and PtsI domain
MKTETHESLLDRITCRLGEAGADDSGLHAVLDMVLSHFDCAVGTIHSLDPASGLLKLRAHRGLPESLLPRVRSIPIGKGMAGLAAERRRPVQVCDLQTDTSGMARPHAKETKMEGSIAVPMLVAESLRGVLGVARPMVHEFSGQEVALLTEVGTVLGSFFERERPVT